MSIVEYAKAYRLGEKEYKSAVAKGEYPYLPVLDDMLVQNPTDIRVDLGLVHIPVNQIVGTYSAGRTTAFARNFMPILPQESEFAAKWGYLYDDMEENGLNTPIKAFEYYNKFYVVEGNKRVSVSKLMNSVSIEGNVTRVVPKRNDEDPNNRLYYEFMDFYEYTGINYLDVRREGTYESLMHLTGHEEPVKWDEEELQTFNSLHTYFVSEYCQKAQNKMNIGSADALAAYIEVFGYKEACEKGPSELKHDIAKMWNEFMMLDQGNEATLVLNPTEESMKAPLLKLHSLGVGALKVAFIHDRSVFNSAWTYSHELGIKYIQEVFGNEIEVTTYDDVSGEDAERIFEEAIEAGNKVIFATSPKLCLVSVKAAMQHPDVKILNCSLLLNHKNIRSYYLRMYEAKFISGAIAGVMTENNLVGYLGDYPIRGTTADINAFALGVQMTNPRAKVLLKWSMEKNKDVAQEYRDSACRIVSGRDMNATMQTDKSFGLFRFEDDGTHINLAAPLRDWGKLYEEIIRSIMIGGYKNDENLVGNQALNYYWGMSSNAVDIVYSRNLPSGAIRLLRTLREGIRNMSISPFTGPIYSTDGECMCEDGQIIGPEQSVLFDWLVENVEGYIPRIEDLKEEAVELVKLQGIIDADQTMF